MRDRPRALAVLVAIFLIGILVGASASYLWLKPSPDSPRFSEGKHPSPPPNDSDRLDRPELNLTPEQEKKFMEIGMETRETMNAFMEEQRIALDKKWESIFSENVRKARAILDEEQKVKYNEWVEKVRDRIKRAPRRKGPEPSKENHRKPERPQSKPPE